VNGRLWDICVIRTGVTKWRLYSHSVVRQSTSRRLSDLGNRLDAHRADAMVFGKLPQSRDAAGCRIVADNPAVPAVADQIVAGSEPTVGQTSMCITRARLRNTVTVTA
jgi:hypothetical protein